MRVVVSFESFEELSGIPRPNAKKMAIEMPDHKVIHSVLLWSEGMAGAGNGERVLYIYFFPFRL